MINGHVQGGVIDLAQVQQQQAENEAYVNDMSLNAALQIFSKLAADYLATDPAQLDQERVKLMAHRAKLLAPFLAQAYGLCEYKLTFKPAE